MGDVIRNLGRIRRRRPRCDAPELRSLRRPLRPGRGTTVALSGIALAMLPALGIPHVSASQPSGHVVYLPPELNGAAPAPGPAPTIPPGTAPITSSPSLAGPHGWTASWQGNRVTFRSAFALSPNTTFAATLGNRDVATSLARQTAGLPFSWSFTTG